jgi:quinol monooxygenase YgiN
MKTKSLLSVLALAAILFACTNKPKQEEQGCNKKDTCIHKDSACCKKADTIQYSKIIAAKLFVKPEKINEFTKMFQTMIDSTRMEPGCTGYQLFQSPSEKGTFLVFENYKNQAAMEAHFASPYFKALGDKMKPLASKPAEVVIYDVAKEVKQ